MLQKKIKRQCWPPLLIGLGFDSGQHWWLFCLRFSTELMFQLLALTSICIFLLRPRDKNWWRAFDRRCTRCCRHRSIFCQRSIWFWMEQGRKDPKTKQMELIKSSKKDILLSIRWLGISVRLIAVKLSVLAIWKTNSTEKIYSFHILSGWDWPATTQEVAENTGRSLPWSSTWWGVNLSFLLYHLLFLQSGWP